MSMEIIPLDFESHAVRSLMIEGRPWFVAADVCRVLEHSNTTRAISRLDDDEKQIIDPNHWLGSTGRGGAQAMSVITQGAVIALTISSKLPKAKRLRRWLTDDVIPALLRDGTYSLTDRNRLAAKRAHFATLPGKVQDRAAQRREVVEFVNAGIAEGARIGDVTAEAVETFGVSASSIHRWRSVTYMVADPDIEVALAPKWPHGPREMVAKIHPDAMVRYLELVALGLSFRAAFKRLQLEASNYGWGDLPCCKTMTLQARRVLPRLDRTPKTKSIQ